MYRLLIVTGKPEVGEMFAAMDGWEAMGFKQPRLRASVDEAVACMHKHHIDAIAIDDDPAFAPLEPWLDENAPSMPIFEIGRNPEDQLAKIREVELLLNYLHTDNSNDNYDEAYYFQMARTHWMKRLISGMAPSKEYVLAHQRMYRCKDEAQAPCVFARISLAEGEQFLSGRWHYGSERLETALRNFFGLEHDHLAVHLAIVSPDEMRVVVCPKMGAGMEMQKRLTAQRAEEFIREAAAQVENYLGLKLDIVEVDVLNGLTAFAADNKSA
ncbi:MAG: hypothetical protein PHY12_09465 [Eubacteriales bacterium]|nr:hypothetical protein [Eubacteriales bacterium]